MKIKKFILTAIILFSFSKTALATETIDINWNLLNLSQSQASQINKLDAEWKLINSRITASLTKNQKQLKIMLTDPNSSECSIRNLYVEIISDQQNLKYQALEIFLAKRRLLTKGQLTKLHKMLK